MKFLKLMWALSLSPMLLQAQNAYWQPGQVEFSVYKLERRGAENRVIERGQACVAFSVLDVSKSKLVPVSNAQLNPKNISRVLHLEASRRYEQGMEQEQIGVHTPLNLAEESHSHKITSTWGNWQTQNYVEVNLQARNYRVRAHLNGVDQGDKESSHPHDFYWEEELLNRLRLQGPAIAETQSSWKPALRVDLPTYGPTLMGYANLEIKAHAQDANLLSCILRYENRTVQVHFQKEKPYLIQGWEIEQQYEDVKIREIATLQKRASKTRLEMNGLSLEAFLKE